MSRIYFYSIEELKHKRVKALENTEIYKSADSGISYFNTFSLYNASGNELLYQANKKNAAETDVIRIKFSKIGSEFAINLFNI